MTSLVKILIAVVLCIFVINLPVTKSVESRTNPTATKSRTRTATATASTTPSLTATNTVTPSPTVTSSPTMTFTPSPTPVQKTEIKVFDNVSLLPVHKVSSDVIDVRNYSEVTVFVSSQNGPFNTGSCYFLPDQGTISDRYKGDYLTVTTGSGGFEQMTVNAKVIGPNLICEVQNNTLGTKVTMYLYLIP